VAAKILTIAPQESAYRTRESFVAYCSAQIEAPESRIDKAIKELLDQRYLKEDFTPTTRRHVDACLIDALADYFDRSVERKAFERAVGTSILRSPETSGTKDLQSSPAIEEPLVTAVLIDYLKRLINESGELPRYYPDRLRCNLDLGHLWQDVNLEIRSNDQHRGKRAPAQLTQNAVHFPGLMNSLTSSVPTSNITAEQAVSTWTAVRQDPRCRQAVILGDAGSGKSWLLRYEARRVAQASLGALQNGVALDTLPEIPVLQSLADLFELVGQGQTLLDAVLENLKGEGASELLRETIATLFRAGKVALLLDAWDEVAAGVETPSGTDARALLRRRIEQFSKSYDGRILLSSRKVRYSSGLMPHAMELDVLPLKFAQIRRFLRSWFEIKAGAGRWNRRGLNGMHPDVWYPRFAVDGIYSATRRDRRLSPLVGSPLMLALMCRSRERRSHRSWPPEMPSNNAQLYEMLLNGLLFDWRTDDKSIDVDQLERNLRLSQLSRAAWAAQLRPHLSEIELARSLGFDPVVHASQARGAIAELKQTGILVQVSSGNTMFLHRSFQEYLTAAYIAVQPDALEQIKRLARNPDWHDVVILTSSLVDRPFDLVIDLLADGPDSDLTPRNHSLAVSVWGEAILATRGRAPSALGAWDMRETLRLLIFTDWTSIGKIARIHVNSRENGKIPTLDEILKDLPGVRSSHPADSLIDFLSPDFAEKKLLEIRSERASANPSVRGEGERS